MKTTKRQKLERNGWSVGSTTDLLDLSAEESQYIELKIALSRQLEKKRKVKHLTQHQLADIISSSQSRVAKMEKGDMSVSLDLLIRSLLALGTSKNELATAIVSPSC
jgi:predicted XRE-type DNA-binding protein